MSRAAVVASPTLFHHEIGLDCLNRGKHVLMEKPIALNHARIGFWILSMDGGADLVVVPWEALTFYRDPETGEEEDSYRLVLNVTSDQLEQLSLIKVLEGRMAAQEVSDAISDASGLHGLALSWHWRRLIL